MEMNTKPNAVTHVSRDRFACPQLASLRITAGVGRTLQGTGVSSFGAKVRPCTDAITTYVIVPDALGATFATSEVAFHSLGRPPV